MASLLRGSRRSIYRNLQVSAASQPPRRFLSVLSMRASCTTQLQRHPSKPSFALSHRLYKQAWNHLERSSVTLSLRRQMSSKSDDEESAQRLQAELEATESEAEIEHTDHESSDGENFADDHAINSIVSFYNNAPRYSSVPAIPVPNRPLFPGIVHPVVIHNPKLFPALAAIQKQGGYVGVFLSKNADPKAKPDEAGTLDPTKANVSDVKEASIYEEPPEPRVTRGRISRNMNIREKVQKQMQEEFDPEKLTVHQTGTFARIIKMTQSFGAMELLLLGHRRCTITSLAKKQPYMVVNIDHHDDPKLKEFSKEEQKLIKAYCNEISGTFEKIRNLSQVHPLVSRHILEQADFTNPGNLCDYVATCSSANVEDLQDIMGTLDLVERLKKTLVILEKDLQVAELQRDIHMEVESKMKEQQKKFMAMEQIKALQKVAGVDKDPKPDLVTKFRDRIKDKQVPEQTLSVIEEELSRLESLDPASAEFSVSRNYLDWLTLLPYDQCTEEVFDIEKADELLNKEHYGLEDVKKRVLEFIAVGNLLNRTPHGKIICLLGPPGTGKTSIGRSIAKALNRKFYRFSVGGLHDVAEIKGHRRTYVGAMPGKPVQCFKTVQSANPVILIDEIDKIGGRSMQGDPSSALLEMLDPEQNKNFLDHYLDVPVDLSKVLFICTANEAHTIPPPLADRMEFIEIAGYVAEEKLEIAKRHLEPTAMETCGLDATRAELTSDTMMDLIRWYCREAGVRNLQKHIEQIYRKLAFKIVKENITDKITITPSMLVDYVGQRKFISDRLYEQTPPGVTMGLAANSMGGATTYIESTVEEEVNPGTGSLVVTGKMGEVMKESTTIALTVAKGVLKRVGGEASFFSNRRIHMHSPEGAVPKEGPSAGVTMVTTLISLALNRPVKQNLAMTGEVTLTGRVLPIGGVRDKVVAAKRAGVTEVILPATNKKDFVELPDFIQADITAHFVTTYDEVYEIALGYDDASTSSSTAPSASSETQAHA